jgi:hypothetical protein
MTASLSPYDKTASPIIIAGMHRSGTSMTASFLGALGVQIGDRFRPASRPNPKGFFEDLDFVELQRAMLEAATSADEPGWPDAGYTESERLDWAQIASFAPAATQLIAARQDLATWGWKDPRTTVLLPFWHELMPQARYVFVYRFPWDVADSMFRQGNRYIGPHPHLAYRMWTYYNRAMLTFYRANADRCVMLSTNALPGHLDRMVELLAHKLGLPVGAHASSESLSALIEQELMHHLPPEHPVVHLAQMQFPEAVALLRELDAAADMPGGFETLMPPTSGSALLHHSWVQAERSTATVEELTRQFNAREADLRQRLQELEGAMQALRASTSWRVTAPLRGVMSTLRRQRPGDRQP